MTNPILMTKLYTPLSRPNLVSRPRLIERLDEGVRSGRKLTLVSAPAGYGKTTLIGEWIARIERPAAWLSLDEADNDPVQFLRYLIVALQQIKEDAGQAALDILGSPQVSPVQNLITPLINEISAANIPLVLALDDYHLISDLVVQQTIQFLVEYQPPSMHTVIITREDPALPLPRLRVRGQITELRDRDLRFTVEEATAFLNATMGLSLSAGSVASLEERTEGWIAGLQLAALALQQSPKDSGALLSAFAGDDRYIRDYLATEVLNQQPQEVRDFLRRTALLDRMTASLCDAVIGRTDSRTMIDHLEGANLFLVPLDHRREWYRYHNFFAEFLRTTLERDEEMILHRRAAQWYETHGLIRQAIRHALACSAISGDYDEAQRLIGLASEDMFRDGAMATIRNWLSLLPDKRIQSDGKLATYKGWVLTLSGEIDQAEEYAEMAETAFRQAGTMNTDMGILLTLRAFIAGFVYQKYDRAIELSAEALKLLDKAQTHWRIMALWTMAESQERTRPIPEAIATFREARRSGLELGSHFFVAMVEMTLIMSLNNHGQRQDALAACEEAISRHDNEPGSASLWTSLIFTRLGTLYYESNDLKLSREYYERSLLFKEQFALEFYQSITEGISAQTLYAQGETRAALAALHKAQHFGRQSGFVDIDCFLAWEANIQLKEGDIASALRWVETSGLSIEEKPEYLRMDSYLVYSRLLLIRNRLAEVRRWLARLEQFALERGLYRPLITIYILQALVADRSGDGPAVLDRLTRALQIAAPQNYARAFLDEGPRVMALLPQVRQVAPHFVDRLVQSEDAPRPEQALPSQPLIEPLSERELEVLRLIAAGLSNGEIAGELVITTGTVKRHINHIYGKLDVHSRTQAVAKAREIGLM